jgi:hypothetical protein
MEGHDQGLWRASTWNGGADSEADRGRWQCDGGQSRGGNEDGDASLALETVPPVSAASNREEQANLERSI